MDKEKSPFRVAIRKSAYLKKASTERLMATEQIRKNLRLPFVEPTVKTKGNYVYLVISESADTIIGSISLPLQ